MKESGSITVKLPVEAYAGLAVCAHDKTKRETALFSNMKIAGANE